MDIDLDKPWYNWKWRQLKKRNMQHQTPPLYPSHVHNWKNVDWRLKYVALGGVVGGRTSPGWEIFINGVRPPTIIIVKKLPGIVPVHEKATYIQTHLSVIIRKYLSSSDIYSRTSVFTGGVFNCTDSEPVNATCVRCTDPWLIWIYSCWPCLSLDP